MVPSKQATTRAHYRQEKAGNPVMLGPVFFQLLVFSC